MQYERLYMSRDWAIVGRIMKTIAKSYMYQLLINLIHILITIGNTSRYVTCHLLVEILQDQFGIYRLNLNRSLLI